MLDRVFDGNRAFESVQYFTQFWRIGGGPGFDSCLTYIQKNLERSGFSQTGSGAVGAYYLLENQSNEKVWNPFDAVLSLEAPEQRVLLSFSEAAVMLCKNSFPADVQAPLIYVKGGDKESDYDQVAVDKKIVLCDAHPARAYALAMRQGAYGVVSSFVPSYNEPGMHPDLIAETGIPYDETLKPFALKVSPAIATELQTLLSYTEVIVRVQVKTTFSDNPIKTLVAEIPGSVKPQERVLLIAHLDHYKPGANDNASGSATLLEILRSLSTGIQQGRLEKPARTLTFLWVDEYKGTGFWIKNNEAALKDIRSAFVLDMVGGNPEKTGGTFRVEKMPDPSVVWFRPPDQHSGWGVGQWDKAKLFGSYLSDFYLAIVEERSKGTGWKTSYNVWEGGSDHDPFLWKGVPAISSWHFPDYAYHSSKDGIENISPTEMKNAGISNAAAALALSLGTEDVALQALASVTAAAEKRLTLLTSQAITELEESNAYGVEGIEAASKREREILDAWIQWYGEAFQSVLTIPAEPASEKLSNAVQAALSQFKERARSIKAGLGLEG